MKPIAVDLFAGAGGATLGLRRAGFDVRVAVDIDPYKASTLLANNPTTNVLGLRGTTGDIRKLDGNAILTAGRMRKGSVALLVGCPPCQGFSLQGNRDPNDQRNLLPFEFVRLVRQLRPETVVFENVLGFRSFESGKVMETLHDRLADAGYNATTWSLDAKDYGIPQARKRVFIVGARDLELPTPPRQNPPNVGVWEAIADLPTRKKAVQEGESVPACYRYEPRSQYAKELRGKRSSVTNCEVTQHAPSLRRRIASLGWEERDSSTWHRRLHPRKPAPTLTAGSRTRTACRPVHPFADRVITIREAARLASFPDWYLFPNHFAEAWSQIGNAVPPRMAERVFLRIRSCMERGQ